MTRVLIVEDEPAISEAIRYRMKAEGFHCFTAPDGASAMERFRRDRPDLVLLDVMLPGASGIEVLREIRRSSTTPVVLVTARDSLDDKVLGLDLGADQYITKPFTGPTLMARVRAVLRSAGMAPDRSTHPETLSFGPCGWTWKGTS